LKSNGEMYTISLGLEQWTDLLRSKLSWAWHFNNFCVCIYAFNNIDACKYACV